jgi:hypothetical protein
MTSVSPRKASRASQAAYHEAGHAAADLIFGHESCYLTIQPDPMRGMEGWATHIHGVTPRQKAYEI